MGVVIGFNRKVASKRRMGNEKEMQRGELKEEGRYKKQMIARGGEG